MKIYSTYILIALSILAPVHRASPVTVLQSDDSSRLERRTNSFPSRASPIPPNPRSVDAANIRGYSQFLSPLKRNCFDSDFTPSDYTYPSKMPNNIVCYFSMYGVPTYYFHSNDTGTPTFLHKFRYGRSLEDDLRPQGLICTSTAGIVPFNPDARPSMSMCALTTNSQKFKQLRLDYRIDDLDLHRSSELGSVTFTSAAMNIPNRLLLHQDLAFDAVCFNETDSQKLHESDSMVYWPAWDVRNWPKDSKGQPIRFEVRHTIPNRWQVAKNWLKNPLSCGIKFATVEQRLRTLMVYNVILALGTPQRHTVANMNVPIRPGWFINSLGRVVGL
ncbi:hypothetical protein EV360DRAFT_79891 [Lentinula raphanica]|nr:hypothetical protein EV360DRAFT_79891 [Lentinula raphanica]